MGQSGGVTLEQAGEEDCTSFLPSKFGGVSWDSDEPHFLAHSGHWAWLLLPYFVTSGQPASLWASTIPLVQWGSTGSNIHPESTLRGVKQHWGPHSQLPLPPSSKKPPFLSVLVEESNFQPDKPTGPKVSQPGKMKQGPQLPW